MQNPFLRIVDYVLTRHISAQEAARSLEAQRQSAEQQRRIIEAQIRDIEAAQAQLTHLTNRS